MNIVTAVMNRNEQLAEALDNWFTGDLITVVDWSSPEPIKPDPRMLLIRINGEEYFNSGRAFNLAIISAPGFDIIKMDVDYRITDPKFLQDHRPGPYEFVTGSYQLARESNERYLNGFLRVEYLDFYGVEGYREDLEQYGWDDDDLYNRLTAAGLRRKYIRPGGGLIHVPHSDELRVQNFRIKDLDPSVNMKSKAPWVGPRASYEMTFVAKNHLEGSRIIY